MAHDIESLIRFLEGHFASEIKGRLDLPATGGKLVDFPPHLHPMVLESVKAAGIHGLYTHQRLAFDAMERGEHVTLISPTASGKTLGFLLYMLHHYQSSPFSAFLLYPTKALARDQEGKLFQFMSRFGRDKNCGTYDGDTPVEERQKISRVADFVLTNPDMLHSGILPHHHRKWKSFLSRLKFIVVDEVHIYRGAFGSHVANVFRRLLRICAVHGARPTFVCSSATVGNPREHVESLFGAPMTLIDEDGAPRPRRTIILMNPAIVEREGERLFRKGPSSLSIPLLREAAKQNIRAIGFCKGRQEVERLHHAITRDAPNLKEKIKPYRGGLLPSERRNLERELFQGKIVAIISTNALELGIDIGDLDLCVMSGHPGSLSSFWQQAGRVGRKGKRSLVVFIARDMPIDQFLVHHPEFLTGTPVERAWLNCGNPYIFLQHLPCAAHEFPLAEIEPQWGHKGYRRALELLVQDSTLKPWGGRFRFVGESYPARGVNLRGLTDFNILIYHGSEVIGEIDPIGARGTLYKDAIYQHLGQKFMSLELDLEKKLCRVEPTGVDYFTEASWEGRVTMEEVHESRKEPEYSLAFGEIQVNKQPKLYKKIRERTFENIGYGPITLPPFDYDTTGFALTIAAEWEQQMNAIDDRYRGVAMHGVAWLFKRAGPSLCMGDMNDIDCDVALGVSEENSPVQPFASALFLYDTHEGGVGFAEKLFEIFPELIKLCLSILQECECGMGCPACVPPEPPGFSSPVEDPFREMLVESNIAQQCALSLFQWLQEGRFLPPKIRKWGRITRKTPAVELETAEDRALNAKMDRALGMLRKRREREH